MAVIYLPRTQNPFLAQLPSIAANLVMQHASQKFRRQERAESRKQRVQDMQTQAQMRGFTESEARIPAVEIGGKGFDRPEWKPVEIGGRVIGYEKGGQFFENKSESKPNTLKLWEAAKADGYEGSLVDFMKIYHTRGSDNSYYSPIKTDKGFMSFNHRTGQWEVMPNQAGTQPLPIQASVPLLKKKEETKKGVERAFDIKKAFPKARNQMASLNRQWDLVSDKIDKALTQIKPYTAGVGAWSKIIPGTPAKNLMETLMTIKSNIGFETLAEMRASSQTGGALGQVSEFENKLLQAVKGSLEQEQSPQQLRDNLMQIKALLQLTRIERNKAYKTDFASVLNGAKKEAPKPKTLPLDQFMKDMGF